MEIIQLKGVTKEFGDKVILDNVSFSIEEGDIFGIIGQSGSGKSTLLNTIVGFYEPEEGTISYQLDINKKPKIVHNNLSEVKKRFGFAAQISSFYPKLTLKENLSHFGKLYGIKKETLKTNIKNLLEFTELKNHQNKLSEHISVGMQKRLDLSCSLIHKPKVLLLDEPTADLDPILQEEIMHLIKQANRQGITIIIASHHLESIEEICNKIAIIDEGKIINWGTIEDIKKPYQNRQCTIHLKSGEHHQKIANFAKDIPDSEMVDEGSSITLYAPEIQKTLNHLMSITQKENLVFQELDITSITLQEIFEKIIKERRHL